MTRFQLFWRCTLCFLCVVGSTHGTDETLLPVDGRLRGWSSAWQYLESVWEGDWAGSDMAALFIESPSTPKTLVVIKRDRAGHATLYISRLSRITKGGESIEGIQIRRESCPIDIELALAINKILVAELLKTRYSDNAGRVAVMDGTKVVVGATSVDRPYLYFMGQCNIAQAKNLAWIELLSEKLIGYLASPKEMREDEGRKLLDFIRFHRVDRR